MVRVCLVVALVAASAPVSSQQAEKDELLAIFRSAVKAQEAGQLEQAEAEYRRFLEKQPRNVEALANLGVVYVGLGRYDEAIAVYRRALEVAHLNAQIRMNLALAYYKSARYADAIPEFERVLEANPGLYNAVLLKADSHLQLGEYAKAIALLQPIAKEREADNAFNYVFGMALLQNKQANEGAIYLDRILRQGDSAEARLLMGLAQRAAADFAGARDEFAKAVALNPSLPMAHSLYGQMLLTTGDRESARAAFLKELQRNPTDFDANLLLGVILKEDRDFAPARAYLEKAIAMRPDDLGAQYQLATLLLASGENEPARVLLERIVAVSPDFTEAHVSLATVYFRLRRRADGDRHRKIAEQLAAEAQARQPGAQTPAPQ